MLEDGTLKFLPAAETESLRQDPQYRDVLVVTDAGQELKAGDGVAFELKMKVDLEETDADTLELILRSGSGKRTLCRFDLAHGQMSVDRNASDGWSRGVSRSTLFLKGKRELDIHISQTRVPLRYFPMDIRTTIPTMYLLEMTRTGYSSGRRAAGLLSGSMSPMDWRNVSGKRICMQSG